jgi:predicted metallopeptidase
MAKKSSKRMRYELAPDLQARMEEMIRVLEMEHVDISRVACIRSFGSSARGTIARCHTIGKVMQMAMGTKAHYAIEFLERFEKMSWEEQDKTIIHELMHIPKSFGGGFRQHDFVCDKNVEIMHDKFVAMKKKEDFGDLRDWV